MIKKNKTYLLILLSIIILFTTIFQRIRVESTNKVVDVVLDYVEMNDMALQSNKDLQWWFSNFKDLGVKYVALHEETLESMVNDNKDVEVIMAWDLLQSRRLREIYLADLEKEYKVSKYDVLINTKSREIFNFIYSGLSSRYDENLFEAFSISGNHTILLKGRLHDMVYSLGTHYLDAEGDSVTLKQVPYTSKLIKLGLGFDSEKLKTIKDSGLEVLPRPSNYNKWTEDKYIRALFNDFNNLNMVPPVFLFTGSEILGYPDYNNIVSEYMIEKDIKVGLIETAVQREHIKQEGLENLVKDLDYNAVRIFSVWPYIQRRFKYYNYEGAEEIENTLYRAVTERNIRMVYFKPFKEDLVSFVTDFVEYEKMFNRFEKRIAVHGMTLGRSSVMATNRVRIYKQTIIGWGVMAAGILLLTLLVKISKKMENILLIINIVLMPLAYFIKPLLMEKVMALAASIIFPSLAMVWLLKVCKDHFNNKENELSLLKIILIGVKNLIIVSGISLLGGLFVSGILSNTQFLLEVDIFRGVKASQLIPIAVYLATYMAYFGFKNKKQAKGWLKWTDIKSFLFKDVKIIYVLVGAVILVAGYVYIARTGHETNVQPSNFEMIARNILEEKLLARPRTKEFLMGFPALMIAIYFARRKNNIAIFFAGLVAIIGQTSIANTFSHLRTPIYLSLIRSVYSLIFGIVLGVIYVVIIEFIFKSLKLSCRGAMKGRN